MSRKSAPLLLALSGALLAGVVLAEDKPKKDRAVDKVPIPPLKAFDPPAAKPVKLPNGIECFLLEDHELPLVDVQLVLRAGSVWDAEGDMGTASLAGSVWRTGGTKTHPKEKLDELLEKHGMSLEAGIGHDQGSIHLSCLKEDLDLGLTLVKELLTEPLFPEDKLEQAKQEHLSGIEARNDRAPSIAGRVFAMQIYGKKSPYARVETPESVAKVKQADVVAWHRRFVRPDAVIVGAFGDVRTADLEKKLAAAIGDWKAAGDEKPLPMPLVEVTKKPAFIVIDKPDVNQSAIHVGHVGTVRAPDLIEEYAKVLVANEILGSGGFSSRLMLHVRSDQGLAYSVGSAHGWDYDHPGMFRMICETKSESTVQAIKSLVHELETIRKEPCSDEELATAKDSSLNQIPFLFDTTEKSIDNALRYAYRSFPQDTIKRLIEGVRKVTKEDVLRVAKSYWSPESLVIVVCGNVAEIGGLAKLEAVAKTPIEKIDDPEAWAQGAAGTTVKPEKAAGGEGPELTGTLAKIVEGAGGRKALDGLTSMKIKQTTSQDGNDRSEEITFQFPDKIRWVMEAPGMGKVTVVINGNNAAAVIPGQPNEKIAGQQLTQLKGQFVNMTIAILKGIVRGDGKIVSEADTTFAGKAAKKVVLDVKGSRKQTFFIDATTGALLGKEQDNPGGKLHVFVEANETIGGVTLPKKLAVRKEGDKPDAPPMATVTIEGAEANPKLADDTFKVPDAAERKPDPEEDDK